MQRTYRMPKDIHVEPERFAAQLISRLETVLREREAQERLEERLKRVRLVSVRLLLMGRDFDNLNILLKRVGAVANLHCC